MTLDQKSFSQLAATIDNCACRGLYQASKWLSELLLSASTSTLRTSELYNKSDGTRSASVSPAYVLAKSVFDCHEYSRCALFIKNHEMMDSQSQFLRFYALYLASEKDREEDSELILGPKDTKTTNPVLVSLTQQLESLISTPGTQDSYLLYLYGMFQRRLNIHESAIKAQMAAINLNPWNWPAWQELSCLMNDLAMTNSSLMKLPRHVMADIFHVATMLDLHLSGEEITSKLNSLDEVFPNSSYFKTQRAILAYNAQDFELAETLFEEIIKEDPHRLDCIDVYSNVLFVLERRAKLGHLAKTVAATDKFRPETCCVIGNYYSLMSDHEKAVTYFRKALKLNRSYLAAWTLMGHEYVELKNTHAAVESYRRAVDINNKDYRAWYGLGQAYEMLEMHYYALHYFQRAAALKPYDVRMWAAVGNCHEKLGRLGEAIKAFKRALLGDGNLDLLHLMKIGDLQERSGDTTAAYRQFRACVELSKADDSVDVSRAKLWIQRYEQNRK